MDNRVGTGRTLARGFGFLFGHVFDVIGLGWLAAVFYAASIFFLIQRLAAALLVAPPATPLVNQFTLPYFAGMLVATAFFGGAMAVALTRNAAGVLDSRAGVYFVYGAKELRAFWGFVKLYALVTVMTLATGYASVKGAAAIAAQVPPGQIWLNMLPKVWLTGGAAFVTVCVFVFLQARLGFFLAPLAAHGERPLLRHSWQLSRGNSWAIFVATFAMFLFVSGVLAGCYFGFSDSNFNATMIAQRGDPAMWHAFQASAWAIAAICAITLTALNALFAGASASAYAIVEADLERETSLPEPVHAMASAPRIEPGFFPRGEAFAIAGQQPVNVISEPVSTAASQAPVEETPAAEHTDAAPVDVAPAPDAVEDLTVEEIEAAAETTPPPASSAAPQASPEHAPSATA